jgi:hypothetical protein
LSVTNSKPILWKTSFFIGFSFLSVFSYLMARFPWSKTHWILSIGVVTAAMACAFLACRKERSASQGSPKRSTLRWSVTLMSLLLGAYAAYVSIFIVGYLRYKSVLSDLNASGLQVPLPATSVEENPAKNGMIALDGYVNGKEFSKLTSWKYDNKPGDGLLFLTADALKFMREEPDSKPGALQKLRVQRSGMQAALRRLDEARRAPGFCWNIHYDVPFFNIQVPRLAGFLKLSRIVAIEAVFLEQDGDSKGAEKRLSDGMWMADQAKKVKDLPGAMISAVIESFNVDAALPLIRRGGGQTFLDSLKEGGEQAAIDDALRVEYLDPPDGYLKLYFGLLFGDKQPKFLHNLSFQYLFAASIGTFIRNIYRIATFTRERGADQFAQLFLPYGLGHWWDSGISAMFENAFELAQFPWVFWQAGSEIEDGLALSRCMDNSPRVAEACMESRMEKMTNESWFLESISVAKYSQMHTKGVLATVRERMAKTAFALVLFKKKNGHWPNSIEELNIGLDGINPFDAKPFVLRRIGAHIDLCFFGRGGNVDYGTFAQYPDRNIIFRL